MAKVVSLDRGILFYLALVLLPLSVSGQVDSTHLAKYPKVNDSSATTLASTPQAPLDSTPVVKHSFNHRQQIITGSVVMACLALIMVTMNNYNPR